MTPASTFGQRGTATLPGLLTAGYRESSSATGTDAARPYVLGYIDGEQLRDDQEIADSRAQIGEYAISQRLQLGSIYVDRPGGDGAMFRALLASIDRFNPAHVLVPDLAHVAVPVGPGAETRRQRITDRTAAALLPIDAREPDPAPSL